MHFAEIILENPECLEKLSRNCTCLIEGKSPNLYMKWLGKTTTFSTIALNFRKLDLYCIGEYYKETV
jgi:hypothetical protein